MDRITWAITATVRSQLNLRCETLPFVSYVRRMTTRLLTNMDVLHACASADEASLGHHPVIASISCGAERRFLLRPKPHAILSEVDDARWEYTLAHGSLLVMSGATQEQYKHSLPKMAAIKKPRVNITYRRVVSPKPSPAAD
jgi:2OG-Fe(II) oxygenase superfamily